MENVHGHHSRVGVPPDGGTTMCIRATGRRAFNGNIRFVGHLTSTDDMDITSGFNSLNGIIAIVATSTGVCVPLNSLISFRTREGHLRGRLTTTRSGLSFVGGGLSGPNFIGGTPRGIITRGGRSTTGLTRGVRDVGGSVRALKGWLGL